MESTAQRLLAIAIVLLLAGGIVAAQDRAGTTAGKPKARATTTDRLGTIAPYGCLPLPAQGKTPSWYPADLPLPPGSYASNAALPGKTPYRRAVFAAKGSLRELIIYVLSEWRKKGWTLGRGEAEASEAEDNFVKLGTGLRGAFIARSSFCEAGWTWLYVVMGQNRAPRPTPRPTASFTPLVP